MNFFLKSHWLFVELSFKLISKTVLFVYFFVFEESSTNWTDWTSNQNAFHNRWAMSTQEELTDYALQKNLTKGNHHKIFQSKYCLVYI